tara:strand:+ start:401 stop:583 length:183 start_codon:yes stop_codon:yes gene_type:complete
MIFAFLSSFSLIATTDKTLFSEALSVSCLVFFLVENFEECITIGFIAGIRQKIPRCTFFG